MLLYRQYIKVFLLALFAFSTLASCVGDEMAADANANAISDDTPLYLSIHIDLREGAVTNRATNANNYEYGTSKEHAIGPTGNKIIFFDEDNNLYGVYHLGLRLDDETLERPGDANQLEEDEEAVYKRVVHFFARNGKLPASFLLLLNGNEDICKKLEGYHNSNASKTFNEIISEIWVDSSENPNPQDIGFVDSNHSYFTMTTSMYYDGNELQAPVKLNKNIYKSLPEARANSIKTYVERMVAKFSFKEEKEGHFYQLEKTGDTTEEQVWLFDGYDSKEGSLDPDDNEDVGILKTKDITELCKIEVTGWGINALETRSHLFKNTGTPDNYWTDTKYKQYHWSADPHYDYNKDAGNATWRYPWQYRSAVERKDIDYYSNVGYTSPLKNYSYMQFVDETKGIYGNEDRFDRVVYTPENTYDPTLYMNEKDATYLDMRTNLLAGTHLIICAEFLVDEGVKNAETGNTIISTGNYAKIHLYRDRLNVYYKTKKECLAELIRQFNHDLKTQSIMKFHYYNWDPSSHDPNDGKVFTFKSEEAFQLYEQNGSNYTRTTVKYFKDKFQNIPDDLDIDLDKANVLNGDGKLVPWTDLIDNWVIRKAETKDGTTSYIAPKIYGENYDENNDETKTEVTDLDPTNVLKSLLYEWVGAIDHFHYGKMYYAAPIMHNAVNKQEANRSQNTLGDYGVVRNHWYKINLTDIVRIGTPVDVPMDPIVPNHVITNDQIHFKIDIPNWHEIESIVPIL